MSFFSILILLELRLKGFTMGEKAGLYECGMILSSDPVSGFMVSHCMLK